MKHTVMVTLTLTTLFFLAQVIGVFVLHNYVTYETVQEGNVTVTKQVWKDLPYQAERPKFREETSYLPMILIILAATAVVIVLLKFKLFRLWKFWFFLSVWFCLSIALYAFLGWLGDIAVLAAGFIVAFFKVVRRNLIVHNLSELFIYSGLAAIFVPVFSLWSITILLVLISIYDMIAVWQTKHMVALAKIQTSLRMFAGLMIPYGKGKTAIFGGGDIGFPLMFAGVVMKTYGFQALVVSVFVSVALLLLLLKGEKGKFYPAMPFLTAGCFFGYGVLWLFSTL